jgi:DNA-binding protein HU-beta
LLKILRFSACTGQAESFNSSKSKDLNPQFNRRRNNKVNNTQDIMAKALSKSQIVAKVAEKAALTKKQAGEILQNLAGLACVEAKKNGVFVLPGLGKLVLVNRAARIGRNPKTGEQIQIPAKRVVKFRVAKAAKDAILGGKK